MSQSTQVARGNIALNQPCSVSVIDINPRRIPPTLRISWSIPQHSSRVHWTDRKLHLGKQRNVQELHSKLHVGRSKFIIVTALFDMRSNVRMSVHYEHTMYNGRRPFVCRPRSTESCFCQIISDNETEACTTTTVSVLINNLHTHLGIKMFHLILTQAVSINNKCVAPTTISCETVAFVIFPMATYQQNSSQWHYAVSVTSCRAKSKCTGRDVS